MRGGEDHPGDRETKEEKEMSILIKGMEMPRSCNECRFLEGEVMDGLCHASNRWLDDEDYFRWFQYPEGDIAVLGAAA